MVLARRPSSVLGVALLLGALAGCVPSDPEGPPVGLRMDEGTLSVIIPNCPLDVPVSAEVIPLSSETFSSPVWTASGFHGDLAEGVRFSASDWSSVDGSYASTYPFEVSVNLSRGSVGTVFSKYTIAQLQGLPSGTYLVNGEPMTSTDYFASVAKKFPCASESRPTSS